MSRVDHTTPVRALPQTGDVIAAKYRIVRSIGAGGMGAVFEARHTFTSQRFAIKWLLPVFCEESEFVQRFMREARIGGRLEHPNLVEVYDVGEDRGSLYMVMEFLEGETLADRMADERRLSPAEACRLMLPCLRGLAAAHSAGVVHRDLKPENIFLCRTESGRIRPKLIDFGISKVPKEWFALNRSLTTTGRPMGTISYMAVEQLCGQAVDQRCDIYALGVIMYELLSGQLPFRAHSFGELAARIAANTPVPLLRLLPSLAPALSELIERAMARDARLRFACVDDMIAALEPLTHADLPEQPLPLALEFADTSLSHPRHSRQTPIHPETESGGMGWSLRRGALRHYALPLAAAGSVILALMTYLVLILGVGC